MHRDRTTPSEAAPTVIPTCTCALAPYPSLERVPVPLSPAAISARAPQAASSLVPCTESTGAILVQVCRCACMYVDMHESISAFSRRGNLSRSPHIRPLPPSPGCPSPHTMTAHQGNRPSAVLPCPVGMVCGWVWLCEGKSHESLTEPQSRASGGTRQALRARAGRGLGARCPPARRRGSSRGRGGRRRRRRREGGREGWRW